MKIVADKDIPLVEHFFSGIGDVHLMGGREITNKDLKDTDVLVVRTITSVNKDLLQDTGVTFIASATAGIDHVDLDYLQESNIQFAYAPGCNAQSVAEYVLSSLLIIAEQYDFSPLDKTVGIIGCGHVGSMVKKFMQALGVQCLVNDPPLKDMGKDGQYCELDELAQSDIITLHTPLIDTGPYTTRHLVNENFLSMLRPDAILFNTSRGQVVDELALINHLHANPEFRVVLDVWDNEPSINPGLLTRATISTPHIAGYSLDAKTRATRIVFKSTCEFLAHEYDPSLLCMSYPDTETDLGISSQVGDMDVIQLAVLASYDARSDSASLRRELDLNEAIRPQFFDELRKTSTSRREFTAMTLDIPEEHADLGATLQTLGFKTVIRTQ